MAVKKTTTKKADNEVAVATEKKEVSILVKRVTEKSGLLSAKHAYTFIIPMDANKSMVIAAFKKEYKKNPVKVAIARMPSKPLFRAGRPAWKAGYKKAVVTLKESDKIEFM
ncbi:MAG: 50S ribosomal protein L23 [Candidatus Pacebacteria bacterium]|jgi:ribosomal protein L23|nr:50S ribosomal protein L23 [Candidatus Paceibacterota bacterium]